MNPMFDQLPRLASSILRTLEASGASREKLNDARQFVQMITGSSTRNRAPVPSGQTQLVKAKRSQLQLAFVSKADSFSRFAQSVISEPLFIAYEPEFSREGLIAATKELNLLNKQVDEARANWCNSRIERNQVMYDKDVSMYNIAKSVKKYVRAIYGLDSAQYDQLKRLVFINQTKKP